MFILNRHTHTTSSFLLFLLLLLLLQQLPLLLLLLLLFLPFPFLQVCSHSTPTCLIRKVSQTPLIDLPGPFWFDYRRQHTQLYCDTWSRFGVNTTKGENTCICYSTEELLFCHALGIQLKKSVQINKSRNSPRLCRIRHMVLATIFVDWSALCGWCGQHCTGHITFPEHFSGLIFEGGSTWDPRLT